MENQFRTSQSVSQLFLRMTCYDIEEMINFILVKDCKLCATLDTFHRIVKFFFACCNVLHLELLLLLFLVTGLWEFQLFGVIDVTVHDEHCAILVTVKLVTLAVKTQDGKTSWTVQYGVTSAGRFWLISLDLRFWTGSFKD